MSSIMIVDNNVYNRARIALELKQAGYETVSVSELDAFLNHERFPRTDAALVAFNSRAALEAPTVCIQPACEYRPTGYDRYAFLNGERKGVVELVAHRRPDQTAPGYVAVEISRKINRMLGRTSIEIANELIGGPR